MRFEATISDQADSGCIPPSLSPMECSPPQLRPECSTSGDMDLLPSNSKIPKISDEIHSATLERKKNISTTNAKKWKQIKAKADSWMRAAEPASPSFVVLYWEVSKGRHQLVWKGPKHMELFASDPVVAEKFKKAVLEQDYDLQPHTPNPQASHKRLVLPSGDVEDYVADLLYKVMPRIMNPNGKYDFYSDPGNRPDWFPSEMPFKSPNHPKRGDKKYAAKEMRIILTAFLNKCPSLYEIDSAGIKEGAQGDQPKMFQDPHGQPSHLDLESSSSEIEDLPSSPEYPINHFTPQVTQNLQLDPVDVHSIETPLEPKKALDLFAKCGDCWPALEQVVSQIKSKVDLTCLRSIVNTITSSQIPNNRLDRSKQKRLGAKVPDGMVVGKSTGNGDCLFNSASIALFGNEQYSHLLRLASVISAVEHFEHYCEMYSSHLEDVSYAHSFMAAVASSDKVFEKKPDKDTVKDMVHYIFKKETFTTTMKGAYSGLLQVQFLSTATGVAIQQHTEELHAEDYSELLVFPCCFSEDEHLLTINIMWVKFSSDSRAVNHIIPLLPQDSTRTLTSDISQYTSAVVRSVKNVCVMKGARQCIADHLHGKSSLNWIQCCECASWYHSVCVGVEENVCPSFTCCASTADIPIIQELSFLDVQSLYKMNGVSDRAIDFFVRRVLPDMSSTSAVAGTKILSANAYESIKRGVKLPATLQKKAFQTTLHTTIGKAVSLMKCDMVVFPCKPRHDQHSVWHWIVVAVIPASKRAYVLDSRTTSIAAYSQTVVKDISKFLSHLSEEEVVLEFESIEVATQQDDCNCGVHVMNNLLTLSQCLSNRVLKGFKKSSTEKLDTAYLRGLCLLKCYQILNDHKKTRKGKK